MRPKCIKKYYVLMGIVTLIIMVAMLAGQVVTVAEQFKEAQGVWSIVKTFLNMIATLTLGSAFANLFYSHSYLVKDLKEDCFDFGDID